MFRNVLVKDIFREIKGSLNRFLSIFAIVMIGVGFFAGVKSTSPDMKITADKYFKDYRLMDFHIMSTMGFDSNDIKAIKEQKDFNNIMFSYSADAIMKMDNSKVVVKMMAIPQTKGSIGSPLNMPVLSSGRMPEKSGECVMENNNAENQYTFTLGDKIILEPEAGSTHLKDIVKKSEYTIVGFVDTPIYISFMRGASNLGDGTVGCYMMIPMEDFSLPLYTDVYLTAGTVNGYSTFEGRYKDEISRLRKPLEDLASSRCDSRYNEIRNEITGEIDDSKSEISEAENGLEELQSEEEKLKSKLDELKSQEKELQSQTQKLLSSDKQLKSKRQELQSQEKEIQTQIQQLQSSEKQLNTKKLELESQTKELQSQIQQLKAQEKQLQSQIEQLKLQSQQAAQLGKTAEAEQAAAQVRIAEEQLAALQTKIKEAEQNIEKLKTSESELNSQLTTLQAKIKEAEQGAAKIKNAMSELNSQLTAIQAKTKEAEQGTSKIKNAISELTDNLPALQDKIKEARDGIDEGKEAIDDAQGELDKVEKPKWYVQTREDNPGYTELEQSSDRLAAVAYVFPVFFLMVAGLVCLTTMSRMIEEQRPQLGTLKAFGYSDVAIMSKYLIYSGLASLLGSITGIAIGMRFFPRIIFNAYRDMFSLPPLVITFQRTYAILSTVVAIICTVCVALFACYKELGHDSAALMRPKAPRPGKRVILEYITFIWSRMSFTSKVTARNLLRYKARFLMTVMGIAGCGALILSGLGLNNSIKAITPLQFNEIFRHNTILTLKEEVTGEEAQKLNNQLSSDNRLSKSALVWCSVMDAVKDSEKLEIHLYVPEDPSVFNNYFALRHRIDKAEISLGNDGIILTEKASNMLGVSKGDTLQLNSKEKTVRVKVSDIVENYVYHNIYMSPALYADTFGEGLSFNTVLTELKDNSEANQDQFATDWLEKENTLTITFTSNVNENLNNTFNSLNVMVLVMIISAGCLAFVVLYNLTNINITERIREIATIKVLGFYNGEVANYIYRENIVLTLIGVVLGLVSGIFLHKFIVVMGEVDIVMFGRIIHNTSFAFAGALTILFSLFVNFVMYFKLKNVSMVESLKSVD